MWRFAKSLLSEFGGSRDGAVALLFGLTLIPILLSIGLGIDYTRGQTLKKQLGHSLDAAALAVGSIEAKS